MRTSKTKNKINHRRYFLFPRGEKLWGWVRKKMALEFKVESPIEHKMKSIWCRKICKQGQHFPI